MKTENLKVGQLIGVTIDDWEGDKWTYKVLDTDVKNDSRGTIRLQYVNKLQNGILYNGLSGEIIVEKIWFDYELTGRKVVIL